MKTEKTQITTIRNEKAALHDPREIKENKEMLLMTLCPPI